LEWLHLSLVSFSGSSKLRILRSLEEQHLLFAKSSKFPKKTTPRPQKNSVLPYILSVLPPETPQESKGLTPSAMPKPASK